MVTSKVVVANQCWIERNSRALMHCLSFEQHLWLRTAISCNCINAFCRRQHHKQTPIHRLTLQAPPLCSTVYSPSAGVPSAAAAAAASPSNATAGTGGSGNTCSCSAPAQATISCHTRMRRSMMALTRLVHRMGGAGRPCAAGQTRETMRSEGEKQPKWR